MAPSVGKHFLLVPYPTWGHTRPQCALAATLLRLSPDTLVTLLVSQVFHDFAKVELRRYTGVDQSRLHVIHSDKALEAARGFVDIKECFELLGPSVESLERVYEPLLSCKPVRDGRTGEEVPSFDVSPSVAIIDMTIAPQALAHCRAVQGRMGKKCKMLMFAPLSGPFGMWSLTLESTDRNGHLSYYERTQRILAGPESDFERLSDEYFSHNRDLIDVPGLAPFYGYEMCPNQPDSFLKLMGPLLEDLKDWDGLINVWPAFMSKDYQAHWDAKGLPLMLTGPLIPAIDAQDIDMADKDNVGQFLDLAVSEEGQHSVLYISFGTIIFHPTIDQMRILLDTLNTLRVRFLIVRGQAPVEAEKLFEEAVASSSGRGLAIPWADQYAVLAHKATGCFLTHGGSNSVIEAIRFAVPMVFWPATTDQVQTSNALTHIYQIGRELLQVRNGYNIGKETAMGVTVKGTEQAMREEYKEIIVGILRGELGKTLRRNIQEVSREMAKDEEVGGLSREALLRLISMA